MTLRTMLGLADVFQPTQSEHHQIEFDLVPDKRLDLLRLPLNLERMPNLWYLTSESQTMIFLDHTETIRAINSSKQEPVTDFFWRKAISYSNVTKAQLHQISICSISLSIVKDGML